MPTDFSKMDGTIYFRSVIIHFGFSILTWLYYEVAKPYFVSDMGDFEQFIMAMFCGYLISLFYLSRKGVLIDQGRENKAE